MEMALRVEAPEIEGLVFRPFDATRDFPALVDLLNACNQADQTEEIVTLEGMTNYFAHITDLNLEEDVLMAQVGDVVVGHARTWGWVNDAGERLFSMSGCVHPEWRGQGVGRAILQWQEQRAREIVATHPLAVPAFYQTWVMDKAESALRLFKHAGYETVRYGYMMVRPNLDNIPELPLPEGLEVRPVQREHMRPIWEALDEAFRDHWGHRAGTEDTYQRFLNDPDHKPHLWQVAWDARVNEVAGMVLNTFFENENERYGFKRGWTDPICVRRPWRRQGLARALIMRSLMVLRDQGMTEAALGVDAENPNKALHLYESCGYRPVTTSYTLRKQMEISINE